MKKSQIFEDSISDSSGDEDESVELSKNSVNHIQTIQDVEKKPEKKQQIVISIDDSSSDEEFSQAKENQPIGPFSLLLQSHDSELELSVPQLHGPFGGERETTPSRLSTISNSSSIEIKINCASPSSVESLHPDDDRGKEDPHLHPFPVPVSEAPLSPSPPQIQVDNDLFSQQSIESDSEETEIQLSNPLQQLLQVQAGPTTKDTPAPALLTEPQILRVSPPTSLPPPDEQILVRPVISSKLPSTIDSLTNWRKSLWPSLSPFYRILLRCKCVSMDTTTSTFDNKKRGRHGNGKASVPSNTSAPPLTSSDLTSVQFVGLEWTEFWDPNCLESLPTIFEKSLSSSPLHSLLIFVPLLFPQCCRS
jgi:hypothetical protein